MGIVTGYKPSHERAFYYLRSVMILNRKNNLLIEEDIRVILPSLAVEIGLNEAVALQQIYFRLKFFIDNRIEANYIDGYYWLARTYKEWHKVDFPFWDETKIGRIMRELEELPFVVTKKLNRKFGDHRKYYRISMIAYHAWIAGNILDSIEDDFDDPPVAVN